MILPKEIAEQVPRTHLMTESEWRNLGVQQSPGWTHYLIHEPGKFFKAKIELIRKLPSNTLGHPNQSNFNRLSVIFLCFGCPRAELALQQAGFSKSGGNR